MVRSAATPRVSNHEATMGDHDATQLERALERGVTHDPGFEQWANKVWTLGAGAEASLKDFRKDIVIEIYNEAGQLALAYKVFRCWVSEFQALPDLDANAGAVLLQHIKLENEGWERDTSVVEPSEPSFGS
jgi:phage tail-like protein